MALILDQSTLFNFVVQTRYTGQTSGSAANNESVFFTDIMSSDYNSTTKVTTGFNVYYKMRGFNPLTQEYEDWHSMGEPLLTPLSGNSLTDISIISTWIDR